MHPEIYLPPDKEVHYFDQYPDQGLDWYRRHFDGPGRLAIDATPTYALRDDWMAAAAAAVPDARVVLLLRHPVDRLWSAYWYLRSMGLELRPLDRFVREELVAGPERRSTHITDGDYQDVLRRVGELVAEERTLILLQDDLRTDPDPTWTRVGSFLGIAALPRPVEVGAELNVTGTLRSYRLRYWTMRAHLFRRTPRLAHALDRWNRIDRRPPPLPEHLRRVLLERYEPSISAVEAALGRDLPHWRT